MDKLSSPSAVVEKIEGFLEKATKFKWLRHELLQELRLWAQANNHRENQYGFMGFGCGFVTEDSFDILFELSNDVKGTPPHRVTFHLAYLTPKPDYNAAYDRAMKGI